MLSPRRYSHVLCALLFAWSAGRSVAQAPKGAWVYPSATGNLLYQLDNRGQRIADFSQCGYRGGTEPLPNVSALIPQNRWVYVSPGTGDDTALIQAAIDSVEAMTPDANGWRGVVYLNAGEYQLATTLTIQASGVVLKGAGDSSTSGTRLRATDARQYTLISVSNSSSRSTVANTTHDLTQKLVSAGTRTFEVDSTSGLAVGHTVIVKRPSTANWIADIDMDQLGPGSGGDPDDVPWTAGSKDLFFDRTVTRIEGNWITVDAPLPQTFESQYGGGQIWRYTWSSRIQQVGIEDLYGFSDYVSSTDEDHAWTFIRIANAQHGWVRNITAQYFGLNAVLATDGAKWITVADSQCLDPISIIDGGRRYSFSNEGAELSLFVNNYARKGRHDFVFGSTVPGPNVFVHGTADTVYADTGPHHRWSVGGLFDLITINGNEINVQNRGNLGTGHGWAGAYMAVWNCEADTFRVRNPPTARNWLVGSIGTIGASSYPVGADPAGTYDSSGPTGTGKAVHPRSLYYGQLQQRMKWPGSEFREVWLGDVDQLASTTFGDPVNCDATWLAQVEALDALPAFAKFDYLAGSRTIACTLDFPLDPGDTVVAASLTVSLRAVGTAAADNIWLDSTTSPRSFASLGWTPISTTAQTVRTLEVSPSLLADGRLNVALGTNCAVDFAVLHLQVQKAQPATHTITLTPVADAYVQGGVNAGTNFGTATSLQTKDITASDVNREAFLRWDLSGVGGKIVQARVRLAGTSASQAGNESCATLVSSDTWSETALTFNNKPASGKLFAQWLPVTGQPVEFTVTPQVADALLGDDKLSLSILSTDNYGGSGNVTYASRENSTVANRPQLILTFENTAPTISKVADQSVNEDTATTALPVVLGDDFTNAASLTVSGTSSNTTLVPNANIVFGGSGANRTVTVTPAANQSGTATITLTVGDGAVIASDAFTLTVTAVNDAPTISNVADRSIAVNSNTGAIAITVGDIETAATALTLTKASSNHTLVPTTGIVFGGSGASRTVTVTPAANQLGSATITMTVGDGALTTSDTFVLTVTGNAQETWRFAKFGTAANTGTSADTANPDGDAWTNANEYVLGSNPTIPNNAAILAVARSGTSVTFTFTAVQATGTGYAGLTRFYDVETTTNLSNSASWTGLSGYTNITGANQTVTINQPASASPHFYRLKVRLQ
jgi:hypothetical protein